MPAKSERQRRLMAAAAHGATFPKARELRASMTPKQLREFSTTESHSYDWRSRRNLKRGRS